MAIRPLRNVVIVEPVEVTEVHGIVVVEQGKMHTGIVRYCGPGKMIADGTLRPCLVAPGQKVKFGELQFQHFWEDGKKLIAMQDEDVVAVVE